MSKFLTILFAIAFASSVCHQQAFALTDSPGTGCDEIDTGFILE